MKRSRLRDRQKQREQQREDRQRKGEREGFNKKNPAPDKNRRRVNQTEMR